MYRSHLNQKHMFSDDIVRLDPALDLLADSHTVRAAQHTPRRQRRTMLPQAAPHRRQKRCKLFGIQSVSDSRLIADYDPKVSPRSLA